MNESMKRAWAITHGERRKAYGDASTVFTGYAKMWSGLLAGKLTRDLTANDVALMMVALKLAREANNPSEDNVTDAHGYLILHGEIKELPTPHFDWPSKDGGICSCSNEGGQAKCPVHRIATCKCTHTHSVEDGCPVHFPKPEEHRESQI